MTKEADVERRVIALENACAGVAHAVNEVAGEVYHSNTAGSGYAVLPWEAWEQVKEALAVWAAASGAETRWLAHLERAVSLLQEAESELAFASMDASGVGAHRAERAEILQATVNEARLLVTDATHDEYLDGPRSRAFVARGGSAR